MIAQLWLLLWGPPDPKTFSYQFLAGSALTPALIILIYFLFVMKIGPYVMEHRRPFKIDKLVIAYNILQVIVNFGLAYIGFRHYTSNVIKQICQPIDYSDTPEVATTIRYFYYFYLIKLLDLVDTIFFTLRKKYDQASSMHIYHHMGMVTVAWMGFRHYTGGQGVYVSFLNSFVHGMMYFYYLLTIWNPVYKKSIWWKKYLTQLQIVHQAFLSFIILISVFYKDCFPVFPAVLFSLNALFMVYLFVKFYISKYSNIKTKGN